MKHKHITLAALAVIVILVLAACQDDAERVEEHQSRAMAYLEEGKHAEAVIEFKNALQVDPNRADAHHGDVVVALPLLPALGDDRGRARRPGVAEELDVHVVAVGRDLAALADVLEHSQVRLVSDEVERPVGILVGLLETSVAADRLLDGEGLDRPPLLAEEVLARHHHLVARGRLRDQLAVEQLRPARMPAIRMGP